MSARRFARSLARLVRERAGWDRVSRSSSGETDALVRPEDVEAAYRLVLNRGPDPDGRKTYSAMIGSRTVSDLVGCLMSSDEFRRSPLYRVVERREHSDVSPLEVAGLRLFVSRDDPCNRSLWEEGCYEPHLTAAIASVLRPGMVVWNVGANVGFHAMCAARAVGASGRVVAVEALFENARLIQRSALANTFANVTVLPLAASDAWQICRYVRAQGTNGYIEPTFAATATSAADLADPLVPDGPPRRPAAAGRDGRRSRDRHRGR
jgi:hypothetical protein